MTLLDVRELDYRAVDLDPLSTDIGSFQGVSAFALHVGRAVKHRDVPVITKQTILTHCPSTLAQSRADRLTVPGVEYGRRASQP